jgi:hypothetical protein
MHWIVNVIEKEIEWKEINAWVPPFFSNHQLCILRENTNSLQEIFAQLVSVSYICSAVTVAGFSPSHCSQFDQIIHRHLQRRGGLPVSLPPPGFNLVEINGRDGKENRQIWEISARTYTIEVFFYNLFSRIHTITMHIGNSTAMYKGL